MRIIKILILLLFFTSCHYSMPVVPTPLELQLIQSREFETTKEIAFASTISVFQDLGYIIEGAEKDTGFITAKSVTSNSMGILNTLNSNSVNTYTRATAFVEDMRKGIARVRLNFVITSSVSGPYGQNNTNDIAVVDPQTYNIAFDKISDTIFIRQGT
jgi:hypothetical protein